MTKGLIERLHEAHQLDGNPLWLEAAEKIEHLIKAANDASARGLGSDWLEKWLPL